MDERRPHIPWWKKRYKPGDLPTQLKTKNKTLTRLDNDFIWIFQIRGLIIFHEEEVTNVTTANQSSVDSVPAKLTLWIPASLRNG